MLKAELKKIPYIERRIRHKRELIEELMALASGTTVAVHGEKIQTSRQADRMAEYVIKAADIAKQIELDLNRLLALQADAIALFDFLPPIEQELMELRYLNGYTWERIAVEMHYSFRQVLRLHGEILLKLFPNE